MNSKMIYIVSIICSGCGFICQMLVSGFWSTAYSNDVMMFSLNASFYFLAMGIGAYSSKKWRNISLLSLIEISLTLILWCGISISILRWSISKFGNLIIIPILVVFIAGFLTGLIIPLAMRIQNEKIKLSVLFFFDYIAALIFTIFFTLFLLIQVGYLKCSLMVSAFSFIITIAIMIVSKKYTFLSIVLSILICIVPYTFYLSVIENKAPIKGTKEVKLLISKQSHYQKIVFTEESISSRFPESKQHVLYLDGFIQFSSLLEYAYHFCITNVPVAAVEFGGGEVKRALILGGGDGLVARNLLYINTIKEIVMVELDPEMINLASNNPYFRYYNKNALHNPKVKVIIGDAFRWVKTQGNNKFDLIVIDFPAPKNLTLARLFSLEFYSAVFKHLNPLGVVAIQAGPSFSQSDPEYMTLSRINSSVKKTIRALGYSAHSYVSTQDEDSFVLATQYDFNMLKFSEKIGIISPSILSNICRFNPSWKEHEVEINTLNTLVLAQYMLSWFKKASGPFFNYRGKHLVFLPE